MAKTKLTQGVREFILDAIVADIPRVDYDQLISDRMIRRAESEIPIPLKEFIKTYPALIEYLGVKQLSRPFYCAVRNELFKPTQEDKDFAEAQRDFEQDQKDRINLARKQIGAWLASANTIEALLESGPQFAAYIPKPEELIARLPALKLAEELGKIGWPKT